MKLFQDTPAAPPPRPRQAVLRLLERIATERDREGLLGDLLEEYEDLRSRRAKAEAERWLLWQGLHSLLPVLKRRVAKAVSSAMLARDGMRFQAVTEGANMFERSLLSLSERQTPRRKLWSVPAAVGLHLFLLFGVLIAQVWSIEELSAPVIQEDYIQVYLPPPPPPPPPPGPRSTARSAVPRPVKQTRPVLAIQQPVFTPQSIPDPVTAATAPELEEFSLPETAFGEDGPPDGQRGGIPCGENCSPGVPGGPGDLPMTISGAVQRPELLHQVQPRYTDCARRAGIQGIVIVEAIIDRVGNVTGARVLRGLGCGLSEEAVRAVEQWKYRPATLNGRPVTVYFTVTAKFTLN